MSKAHEALYREVDWFGSRGIVTGVWEVPTFSVRFDNGSELTIGQDRVTFVEEES